jgi:hypothetical protein
MLFDDSSTVSLMTRIELGDCVREMMKQSNNRGGVPEGEMDEGMSQQ